MNFQRKDFAYQTLPFSTFIDKLTSPTSHLYLRALSSTNATMMPASFEDDWPELSSDIQIPPNLSPILSEAKHSSCLRISNNITMWLHYDVMANVLFQIHGTKKLVLFPPSDIKHLSFPPGSTTSELDIWPKPSETTPNTKTGTDTPHNDDTHPTPPPGTTPYTAILHPGDALYIPPLWAHAGLSLPHDTPSSIDPSSTPNPTPVNHHTNIALNVFFRSLPPQKYAAGRDVYGNRDLSAYEDGRRDIDRIVRRFGASTSTPPPKSASTTIKADGEDTDADTDSTSANIHANGILDSIPTEIARAYLERLADELKKRAAELR